MANFGDSSYTDPEDYGLKMKPSNAEPLYEKQPGGFEKWWDNLDPYKRTALTSGVLSAGLKMMEAGGRSYDRPVSTLSVVGTGGLHGINEYNRTLGDERNYGLRTDYLDLAKKDDTRRSGYYTIAEKEEARRALGDERNYGLNISQLNLAKNEDTRKASEEARRKEEFAAIQPTLKEAADLQLSNARTGVESSRFDFENKRKYADEDRQMLRDFNIAKIAHYNWRAGSGSGMTSKERHNAIAAISRTQVEISKVLNDIMNKPTETERSRLNAIYAEGEAMKKDLLGKASPRQESQTSTTPTLEEFIDKARALNPDATDNDLEEYYNNTYGGE